MQNTPKVAIIGAGLTGLTAAYYLKKAGADITVFEKSSRTGGVIHTFRKDGFVYEGGPNTGVLGHPEVMELAEELSPECEIEIADKTAKSRWIWKDNKWEPLPDSLISGIATPLFTFSDKLRLLAEPFRKKGTNPDENLADLVRRRLGISFLEYAVDPFILGIYAGNPDYLVTKYALPKLYNLEQKYGSFIKGSIKKAKEPKSERDKKATREIFSIKGGLQSLIDTLEEKVGRENFILDSGEIIVKPIEDHSFKITLQHGDFEKFTHVVSTVGAYSLRSLFPFISLQQLQIIERLQYAKVVQVSLGFRNWAGIPLRAFGGLVPTKEKRDILGALFISSFLKNRAPEGGALLSIFMGGMRRPELAEMPDAEIKRIVEKEILQMFQLREFNPDLLHIHRYEHAIPQYGRESEQKLEAINAVQKQFKGFLLAGNIRDGIGMADRIRQGRMVAEEIIG